MRIDIIWWYTGNISHSCSSPQRREAKLISLSAQIVMALLLSRPESFHGWQSCGWHCKPIWDQLSAKAGSTFSCRMRGGEKKSPTTQRRSARRRVVAVTGWQHPQLHTGRGREEGSDVIEDRKVADREQKKWVHGLCGPHLPCLIKITMAAFKLE